LRLLVCLSQVATHFYQLLVLCIWQGTF
jgi:hypothetical protein